jgi:hypothetical protein
MYGSLQPGHGASTHQRSWLGKANVEASEDLLALAGKLAS